MASSGHASDASDDDSGSSSSSSPPRTRGLSKYSSLGYANGVAQLAAWLQLHHPRDVLMPAVRGEKRPAHTHAGGTWTWARYAWAAQNTPARGVPASIGLLLYDLCVVDCDAVADADALEARFPELCRTAMETTARGRHYLFARSPLADAHGYYDGAAQRQPRVDFKTRCWGGGSGFVVLAPSEHKARCVARCACLQRAFASRAVCACAATRVSGLDASAALADTRFARVL